MDASERTLLTETDPMSESTLVRLEDWELAHLRVALLHQLEETLNESLAGADAVPGRAEADRETDHALRRATKLREQSRVRPSHRATEMNR